MSVEEGRLLRLNLLLVGADQLQECRTSQVGVKIFYKGLLPRVRVLDFEEVGRLILLGHPDKQN